MVSINSGLGSLGRFIALGRIHILVVLSLIATWSIAHLFNTYSESIQENIKAGLAKSRGRLSGIKIDVHHDNDLRPGFNSSKMAVLIESRPLPNLVPLLTHMMYVVPPDWRFLFIGSNMSVISVGRSFATQFQQVTGKLDLLVLPEPWEIDGREQVHRLMTDTRFYDEFLPGVEWLLKFEADAVLCSNSERSLDDWLEYDWAGAPRTPNDKFAGNGGLSLRRVSTIKKVLEFQQRGNNTQPEDEWFGKRLLDMANVRVASAADKHHFAVEEVYQKKPMGYHARAAGKLAQGVWKDKKHRKEILAYCPEIGIVMDWKLERERCDGDNGDGEYIPS